MNFSLMISQPRLETGFTASMKWTSTHVQRPSAEESERRSSPSGRPRVTAIRVSRQDECREQERPAKKFQPIGLDGVAPPPEQR